MEECIMAVKQGTMTTKIAKGKKPTKIPIAKRQNKPENS